MMLLMSIIEGKKGERGEVAVVVVGLNEAERTKERSPEGRCSTFIPWFGLARASERPRLVIAAESYW